eukprot:scaffold78669_cov20-Tisochrysis_lutea.AAC.1
MGAVRKDAELKLSAARMWESAKPWITAEERAEAEKKVCVFLAICKPVLPLQDFFWFQTNMDYHHTLMWGVFKLPT